MFVDLELVLRCEKPMDPYEEAESIEALLMSASCSSIVVSSDALVIVGNLSLDFSPNEGSGMGISCSTTGAMGSPGFNEDCCGCNCSGCACFIPVSSAGVSLGFAGTSFVVRLGKSCKSGSGDKAMNRGPPVVGLLRPFRFEVIDWPRLREKKPVNVLARELLGVGGVTIAGLFWEDTETALSE